MIWRHELTSPSVGFAATSPFRGRVLACATLPLKGEVARRAGGGSQGIVE